MKNCFKLVARVLGFEGFREREKKQVLTRGMESDHLKRGEGMANSFFFFKCHKLLLITTLS